MRFIILSAALSAAAPPSPRGTWVSDGYGLVFQIEGDVLDDGPGIAPDVPVLSFTPEGLASGRDSGIEASLDRLAAK